MNRLYLISLITVISFPVWAQSSDPIANRTVWEWNFETQLGEDFLEFEDGHMIIVKDFALMRVLTNGARQIVSLTDSDTILLITLPRLKGLEPNRVFSQITSIRLLCDESKIGSTHFDEYNFDSISFGEAFFKIASKQEPLEEYVSQIEVKLIKINPDELQVTVTGGAYGDATLTYSPSSATPEIVIHK